MSKSSKNNQAVEFNMVPPFSGVATRLGEALADVAAHPDCPDEVAKAISELDARVTNLCDDLEISLRHGFARRLVAAIERSE